MKTNFSLKNPSLKDWGNADEYHAHILYIEIDNTREYHDTILANVSKMKKHITRGDFNLNECIKLWYPLVHSYATKREKEYFEDDGIRFSVADKMLCCKMLIDAYKVEIENGNFSLKSNLTYYF